MPEKSIHSLYLSEDNVTWMKENKLNMSAFVDTLISRAREKMPWNFVFEGV